MDATHALLKELTEGFGPPGHEGEIAGMMRKSLKGLGEVSQDGLGSIICKKKGSAEEPRVMIAGHMDEVGFMVKGITPEGFIKFLPMGGWWGHVVLAQRVIIRTKKGDVMGVVGSKPPHELQEEERRKVLDLKDMFIDVGATSYFDVKKKLGIRAGDPIVPDSPFSVMSNDRLYLAKALDNRVGCALVVDTLRKLKVAKHPNTFYGVATTMEEVGLRGAQTSVAAIKPHVAIAVDVGIAHDTPGSIGDGDEKLGAGAGILVYDASLDPEPEAPRPRGRRLRAEQDPLSSGHRRAGRHRRGPLPRLRHRRAFTRDLHSDPLHPQPFDDHGSKGLRRRRAASDRVDEAVGQEDRRDVLAAEWAYAG